MNRHLFLILLLSGLLLSVPARAAEPAAAETQALDSGMVNPGYEEKPAWFKDSFLDIREDVADAAKENKRVLLYFYQDGCPYCAKLLRENFAIREIVDRTRQHFDVIAINMWGDREVTGFDGNSTTEKEFSKGLRVMFTPTLLFLDEKGQVVLRANGYYPPNRFLTALSYVAGRHENTLSYRDYYKRHVPPGVGKLHADPSYIQEPWNLARKAGDKPLLVLFEQAQCPPCGDLHNDILERPESEALLDKFDVVLLDMWSRKALTRPDGQGAVIAQWAKELDIKFAPSLVFFDAAGKEVFRTEGWLRAFHIQSAMDYVASGAYTAEQEFQRYIAARAEALEAQGIHIDLMQ